MKLTFIDRASAQARQDKIHADMQAKDAIYARSCADYTRTGGKEGTARWDVPVKEGAEWKITADDRARAVLTADEVKLAPEWTVLEVVK